MRRRRALRYAIIATAVALLSFVGLTGCGSKGAGTGPATAPGSTPASSDVSQPGAPAGAKPQVLLFTQPG